MGGRATCWHAAPNWARVCTTGAHGGPARHQHGPERLPERERADEPRRGEARAPTPPPAGQQQQDLALQRNTGDAPRARTAWVLERPSCHMVQVQASDDETDRLPLTYDPDAIQQYWERRPVSVVSRITQLLGEPAGGAGASAAALGVAPRPPSCSWPWEKEDAAKPVGATLLAACRHGGRVPEPAAGGRRARAPQGDRGGARRGAARDHDLARCAPARKLQRRPVAAAFARQLAGSAT